MRMKGRSGMARAVYVTATGRRVVVLHVFAKKTRKTPRRENHDSPEAGKGDSVTRKFIPVEESFTQWKFTRWKKDPRYVTAYEALGRNRLSCCQAGSFFF
jgi:hypothetical protein